jgi:hypothetical protein
MKLLPTMVPEAAASAYKHHPFVVAAPTSSGQANKAKAQRSPGRHNKGWASKTIPPRRKRRKKIHDVAISDKAIAWAIARSALTKRKGDRSFTVAPSRRYNDTGGATDAGSN